MSTGDLVTRVYQNFRGVDFRGDDISLKRSPDSLNMWRNYKRLEGIETRPSLRQHTAFSDAVYGLFFYKGYLLVHSGSKLYRVKSGAKTVLYSGLNTKKSEAFIYENVWYFKDGKHYLQYDGTTIQEVVAYVPTTTIARKPSGGGTIYEDVNMLTGRRKNSFLADGASVDFFLDAQGLDSSFKPIVTVDGAKVTNFSVDYTKGKIRFTKAPGKPKTDGQDNVLVEFQKTTKDKAKILGCTLLQVFDNRVFFSGNKDFPNYMWHCSLDNPGYVSDLDYYREGMDEAQVKGLVAGNNALWVFREPSDSNTNVFYHTPTIDDEYGKIYPSQHSSVTTGCVGRAINFNDDIIFFSERGMEGISGDVTTEQVLGHRSSLVDSGLTSEKGYKDMILAEWEGYLLTFIGKKVYLADSRSAFTNEGHTEYDFFIWEMEKEISCAKVKDGVLYLGTKDGVYTLDGEEAVYSYWTTPIDKFKYPHHQKTTNKKSCTVEALGEEISVYAKTNRDADFALLDTFANVTDAFCCRIKLKKFKDAQLKFSSPKRFSLESATLEVFVGGYLKNL